MQENTNRAIAYNSIILYVKMIINTVCALLTTRFALQALGVNDFGLFSVLGSIISFIGIINTIMVSTSNRFIAVAIGRNDQEEANKQFSVNFIIHAAIAIVVLLIALPIGYWYIPRFVNYDGPIDNAFMVYIISIVGSALSFIGVPYNGLLMAKEKFAVFSLVDIIAHVIKLVFAWLLVYNFENKLFVYALTMGIVTALPTLVYCLYCSNHYKNLVTLHFVKDRQMYKKVFGFSSWIAIGAVTQVGKNQGAALLVNAFFNTAMNSAMGVATSINTYVAMFASNVTQPMQPQITKSYAAGNKKRTDELLIMSTKYSFLLTFLVGSVFLVSPEWLLSLWLKEVPAYASIFLTLFVVDNCIRSLNSGIGNIIFASGNISLYQIFVSSLNALSVLLGYIVLRAGMPAYYLIVAYIFISVLLFFSMQYSLHKTLNYDNKILWRNSYIPSLIIVCLYVPVFFVPSSVHPALKIVISLTYLSVLELFIGLSKLEREKLFGFLIHKLLKR